MLDELVARRAEAVAAAHRRLSQPEHRKLGRVVQPAVAWGGGRGGGHGASGIGKGAGTGRCLRCVRRRRKCQEQVSLKPTALAKLGNISKQKQMRAALATHIVTRRMCLRVSTCRLPSSELSGRTCLNQFFLWQDAQVISKSCCVNCITARGAQFKDFAPWSPPP